MPKQFQKSLESQTGTKSSLSLPQQSPDTSWSVGDKQAMIDRRTRKLSAAGVKCCQQCGGCLWVISGREICGDGCGRK